MIRRGKLAEPSAGTHVNVQEKGEGRSPSPMSELLSHKEGDFMDPILVRDCEILGKVIGLYREY